MTTNMDILQWILHDWSDDHCLKLLKNCYEAIPDNGKVIVMESVLSVAAKTSPAARATSQLDVLMMTQNTGGKERTEDEFMALATGAGFRGIKYEAFVCNFWVMEFFKQIIASYKLHLWNLKDVSSLSSYQA